MHVDPCRSQKWALSLANMSGLTLPNGKENMITLNEGMKLYMALMIFFQVIPLLRASQLIGVKESIYYKQLPRQTSLKTSPQKDIILPPQKKWVQ